MSHIENVTKPVLLPLMMNGLEKRTLNEEAQRILARWIVLRSMVCDTLIEQQYYTTSDRRAFAVPDAAIPPNTHIWLVPCITKHNVAMWGGYSYPDPVDGDHI